MFVSPRLYVYIVHASYKRVNKKMKFSQKKIPAVGRSRDPLEKQFDKLACKTLLDVIEVALNDLYFMADRVSF